MGLPGCLFVCCYLCVFYLNAIYPRIKQCSKLVYDHLSKTCRHGPPVVRLIQDIRTVLSISQSDINSLGLAWQTNYEEMIEYGQYVLQC